MAILAGLDELDERLAPARIEVIRCELTGNAAGVVVFGKPQGSVEVVDTTVRDNLGDGVAVRPGFHEGAPNRRWPGGLRLARCAVTGNGKDPFRVSGRSADRGLAGEGWGVFCAPELATVEVVDCDVDGNAAGGVQGAPRGE